MKEATNDKKNKNTSGAAVVMRAYPASFAKLLLRPGNYQLRGLVANGNNPSSGWDKGGVPPPQKGQFQPQHLPINQAGNSVGDAPIDPASAAGKRLFGLHRPGKRNNRAGKAQNRPATGQRLKSLRTAPGTTGGRTAAPRGFQSRQIQHPEKKA